MVKLSKLIQEYTEKTKYKIKEKWMNENPTLSEDDIERYIDVFENHMNSSNFPKKDIFQYTFVELAKIIDGNYSKEIYRNTRLPIFDINNPTGNDDVLYNENGLVIVKGDLKEKCIMYGKGYNWCITTNDLNNSFFAMRTAPHMRFMFYFVFDKDMEKSNPLHALIISVDERGTVRVADVENRKNSGAEQVDWNYITQIQPKLKNLQYLFKSNIDIPTDMKEKRRKFEDIYDSSNRDELYRHLSLDDKSTYIDTVISVNKDLTMNQWQNTPKELKFKYAQMTPIVKDDFYIDSPSNVKRQFIKTLTIAYTDSFWKKMTAQRPVYVTSTTLWTDMPDELKKAYVTLRREIGRNLYDISSPEIKDFIHTNNVRIR